MSSSSRIVDRISYNIRPFLAAGSGIVIFVSNIWEVVVLGVVFLMPFISNVVWEHSEGGLEPSKVCLLVVGIVSALYSTFSASENDVTMPNSKFCTFATFA